jgi:hypothetical protein
MVCSVEGKRIGISDRPCGAVGHRTVVSAGHPPGKIVVVGAGFAFLVLILLVGQVDDTLPIAGWGSSVLGDEDG